MLLLYLHQFVLQLLAHMEILLTQHQEPVSVELVPLVPVVIPATRTPAHAVSICTGTNMLDVTSQMYNYYLFFVPNIIYEMSIHHIF